jgi:hypothetical protein
MDRQRAFIVVALRERLQFSDRSEIKTPEERKKTAYFPIKTVKKPKRKL